MPPTVHVLWFYGADAVGKSAVGWEAYTQLTQRGVPAAYVDTDSLAFCTPQFDDRARLVELNLGVVWPHFAEAGARCLVVSGILVTADQRSRFAAAIAGSSLTVVRLDARAVTIRSRIVARRRAEADTRGSQLSEEALTDLEVYGDQSVAFADRLRSADIADLVLDTDDASPEDLARVALSYGPWAGILARGSNRPSPAETGR